MQRVLLRKLRILKTGCQRYGKSGSVTVNVTLLPSLKNGALANSLNSHARQCLMRKGTTHFDFEKQLNWEVEVRQVAALCDTRNAR